MWWACRCRVVSQPMNRHRPPSRSSRARRSLASTSRLDRPWSMGCRQGRGRRRGARRRRRGGAASPDGCMVRCAGGTGRERAIDFAAGTRGPARGHGVRRRRWRSCAGRPRSGLGGLAVGLVWSDRRELVEPGVDDHLEPVGAAAVDRSVGQRGGGHRDERVRGGAPVGLGRPRRTRTSRPRTGVRSPPRQWHPGVAPGVVAGGAFETLRPVGGAWRPARPGRAHPPLASAGLGSPASRRRPSGWSPIWPGGPMAEVRAAWPAGSRRPRARHVSRWC